jgi:putative transposase
VPHRHLTGTAGLTFHVINRGARRLRLFETANDYQRFLLCVEQARETQPVKLFAYCVMPNHFHFVLQTTADFQLAEFMRLAQGTHAKRWHTDRQTVGQGAVYQARYRAFAIHTDAHFLCVCRYVERNALRAGLVSQAEAWPWSSLNQRCENRNIPQLDSWPILQPPGWTRFVNDLPPITELARIRGCIGTNQPFGPDSWADEMAIRLRIRGPATTR